MKLFLLVFCFLTLTGSKVLALSLDDYYQVFAAPSALVRQLDQPKPAWLELWLSARQAVQEGRTEEAVTKYEAVLREKKNLEEAQWELIRLRINLRQMDKAGDMLELLLEKKADKVSYLNALGYVMLKKGNGERALAYFQRGHVIDPVNVLSLIGITQVLIRDERQQDALPFLEKLDLLVPEDIEVDRQLAHIYFDLQLYKKARPYAVMLAEASTADLRDVVLAARIHDSLGQDSIGARYWRRVLASSPGMLEAHQQLALFAEKENRPEESLTHLAVLQKNQPGDSTLLRRAGKAHQALGRHEEALVCFENYLRYHPADKEILRDVVYLQAALGNETETLASLERYFTVEMTPEPGWLKRAAILYDAAGRFHDAIPMYQRLLRMSPDDPEILATLADDLLAIGDDDGALTMWTHLATLAPQRQDVYISMVELLERLNREDELLAALKELHQLIPDDSRVSLKLTALYFKRGLYGPGEKLFSELERKILLEPDLLALRGSVFEKLGRLEESLLNYEEALQLDPHNRQILCQCIVLAGRLGIVTKVRTYENRLMSWESHPDWQDRLIVANGYRDSGEDQSALRIYRFLLDDQAVINADCRQQTLMAMSELYQRQELFFEAEQYLRLALLVRRDQETVYLRLAELGLAAADADHVEFWLEQLRQIKDARSGAEGEVEDDDWRKVLLKMRLLSSENEYRASLTLGRDLLASSSLRTDAPGFDREWDMARLAIGLEIVQCEVELKRFKSAEWNCRRLVQQYQAELAPLVLLQKVQHIARLAGQDETEAKAMALAGKDAARMLELTELYGAAENYDSMVRAAEQAEQALPNSLKASLLHYRSLIKAGSFAKTVPLLEQLRKHFSVNLQVETLAARVFFRTGAYPEGLEVCDRLLAQVSHRPDILLLKARILWARHEWNRAREAYRIFLSPPVDDLFIKASNEHHLELQFPEKKKTFWQLISFSNPRETDILTTVMGVSYVADARNDAVSRIAAPLYSTYRWQEKFSRELAAKKSVQRREYFQAVLEHEALVREEPDDDALLFDLAGIYSRLGRLDDEALVYAKLMRSVGFPGLDEAAERNRLKRQPRTALTYHFRKEEGWDNYLAMEQESATASFWYSPTIRRQIDFSASRISYESTEGYGKLKASRALLTYRTGLSDWLDVMVGGGVESLEGCDDTGLLDLGLYGRLGDKLRGHFLFFRDVVTDTTASLRRNVVAEEWKTGVDFDLFPRLLAGGEYRYTNYSDGNELNGYNLWASYIILAEPTFLEFGYLYDFMDASEGKNPGSVILEDGFSPSDYPYWSPQNYWCNRFKLFFKHSLSEDTLDRGTPTYYTAEYLVDYDALGHSIQTLRGGFFVELTPHVMVESTLEFVSSDELRNKDFFVSTIYRW